MEYRVWGLRFLQRLGFEGHKHLALHIYMCAYMYINHIHIRTDREGPMGFYIGGS